MEILKIVKIINANFNIYTVSGVVVLNYWKKDNKNRTPKHLRKSYYKKATRKQLQLLKKLNVNYPDGISSESAHILISKSLEKINN